VRFTNAGTGKHSAQADDLSWGSGTIKPGESFIHTFEEAGTYTFFDNYDSSNTGAVFVE
jgi:plastocyanin